MLIDAVDLDDVAIGPVPRRDVLSSGLNFRVAHLFLFNSTGELLIQQLAPNRERHPLAWGSSVAAYLFTAETYEDAIARRAAQELGVFGHFREVGATTMRDVASTKFIRLFEAVTHGPVRVNTSHISAVEFLSLGEIRDLLVSHGRPFTPTFAHLFAFYERATRRR
jgi:isopentenyl-diphosphate delta-isomerase